MCGYVTLPCGFLERLRRLAFGYSFLTLCRKPLTVFFLNAIFLLFGGGWCNASLPTFRKEVSVFAGGLSRLRHTRHARLVNLQSARSFPSFHLLGFRPKKQSSKSGIAQWRIASLENTRHNTRASEAAREAKSFFKNRKEKL